jgi:hypothetical protein
LEEFGNGKGKLANASEEGQGPRRAVEPMMMMMIHFLKITSLYTSLYVELHYIVQLILGLNNYYFQTAIF